jgi:tRNA threonylcarbamoyladenosine biosynthesis protein TsaE
MERPDRDREADDPRDAFERGETVSGAHRAEHAHRDDPPQTTARIVVPSAHAMRTLGREIAGLLQDGDLVVLTGDLGAGKTTLTQGIGTGLGVRDEITSPTFVIARVHPPLGRGPSLVHVDAYRLTSLAEVDDLDLDASLEDSVTVVEWGEGLVEDLASNRLEIRLRRPRGDDDGGADVAPFDGDEPRSVEITGFGPRWRGVRLPG